MKKTKQTSPISDELIDAWLKQGRKPEDIQGLLKQFTKQVVERAMQGEMAEHLGYEKHDPEGNNSGNSRNGTTLKTLKGDFGEVEIETPRDRNGEFEPRMVKKNQTRWTGFDDKIPSMYSRGMSVRDIQGHLEEMYGVEVSPSLISDVTDGVMEQARVWQSPTRFARGGTRPASHPRRYRNRSRIGITELSRHPILAIPPWSVGNC